jgi:hypothetical protein
MRLQASEGSGAKMAYAHDEQVSAVFWQEALVLHHVDLWVGLL